MYMIRGARGVEVVPHLNYWTEVPLLVKVRNEILITNEHLLFLLRSYSPSYTLLHYSSYPLYYHPSVIHYIPISLISLSFFHRMVVCSHLAH